MKTDRIALPSPQALKTLADTVELTNMDASVRNELINLMQFYYDARMHVFEDDADINLLFKKYPLPSKKPIRENV